MGRPAIIPELGTVYGAWTVISTETIIKNGHTHLLMQCKCGKQELKDLSQVKHSKQKGCASCAAQSRSRDIKIGDKFKHWTVIDGPKIHEKYRNVLWLVECDCHRTQKWVQGNTLMNPNTNFKCRKCATPERLQTFLVTKGAVGDFHQGKFSKIQRCAKARDIEFNLTKEYLNELYQKQHGICAITGDTLSDINESSLDRIDSSKGYIEGNVQWVTVQANKCKHVLSMQELYEFCCKVLNHANQQPSQGIQ